jgi:hypothetical protein
MTRRALGATLLLAACAAIAAGCQAAGPTASPSRPATTQYVGAVHGTQVFAGLATDGTNVTVYLCDGTPAGISVYEWLKGTLSGGSFTATAADGSRVNGQLDASAASGTATLADGRTLALDLPVVSSPAGIYRYEETTASGKKVSGWVELPGGEVRGGYYNFGVVGGVPQGGLGANPGPGIYQYYYVLY